MSDNETTKTTIRRPILILGLGLLALLILAAVVLLVDPFGWKLLDKSSGLRDEAAAAMPPGVALYAGIDLLNFDEETLTEFSRPFAAALAEPGVEDLGDGLERLDAELAQQIGLTLGDDVMPWLGRSVALGLTDLALLPDGRVDRAAWLLVAGTQDRRAADDFLEKLSQQLAQLSGSSPNESDYRGRTITSFGPAEQLPMGGLAFTRSGGQVVIGADEETVRAAIDAQQGESLADTELFGTLTASLPEERGLTLYIDQARLPELNRLLAAAAPLAIGPLDLTSLALPPGAIGVSIVEQGLRLDTAAPAEDDGQGTAGERLMGGQLPADTLAYLTGDSLDVAWRSLKASLEAGGSLTDFEESMALLSREFGYDPDQQLLPLLDGEWVLGFMPGDEGLVAELSGQPLGLVLLANGQDAPGLATAVDALSESLEGQRLPLETVEVGGATATFVDLAALVGAPLPLYGVDGDRFFLGTDAQTLGQVLLSEPAGGGLAGQQTYSAAATLLPQDYRPSAYVDVARLLAQMGDAEGSVSRPILDPVQQLIAGSGPASGGVQPGVLFIIVE